MKLPIQLIRHRNSFTHGYLSTLGTNRIIACDFYAQEAETWDRVPGGYQSGRIVNIDHHADDPEMWRHVSSTNLAIQRLNELDREPDDSLVVISHTDCDSVLSSGIMSGELEPSAMFADAAIAADHTGEENAIADLLQPLEWKRDVQFSFRNLRLFLEHGENALEPEAAKSLTERRRKRAAAIRLVADGKIRMDKNVAVGILDEKIDGELFISLLPDAHAILLFSPRLDSRRSGTSNFGSENRRQTEQAFIRCEWWNSIRTTRAAGTQELIRETAAPPFTRRTTKPRSVKDSHSSQEATITTERKRILHDLEIENDRVSDLLYEDFNIYQANFDAQEDDSAHQDLRASFIAWFMIFAPEVFPPDLAREIASFIGGSLERDEYPTYGWHNTLHLRAGLYGYSKHEGWLIEALANLSHHNSSLRRYVARTIAPVAHLIPTSNELLLETIETNVRESHFFNEYSFLLFLASRGSKEEKLDQLKRWREEFKEEQDYDLIVSLTGDDPVPNPFAPQFRRMERYILLRLCSKPSALPIQRLAFTKRTGIENFAKIDADEVLTRIESHPLAQTYAIPLTDEVSIAKR